MSTMRAGLVNEESIAREIWHSVSEEIDPRVTGIVPKPVDPRTTEQQPTRPGYAIRPKLRTAGIKYLSAIVHCLTELSEGPESDEYGQLRPTPAAFNMAMIAIVDASIVSMMNLNGRGIPMAHVSTDAEGGVRIEWIRDDARVYLVVPHDAQRAYIYKQVGKSYETLDPTAEELASALTLIR